MDSVSLQVHKKKHSSAILTCRDAVVPEAKPAGVKRRSLCFVLPCMFAEGPGTNWKYLSVVLLAK